MKNLKLIALLMLLIGFLFVSCSIETLIVANGQANPIGDIEIRCNDNLNGTTKSLNTAITHYEIGIAHTDYRLYRASKILKKWDSFIVTNLIEGEYNIKGKALIAKTDNPQTIDDFIVVAETEIKEQHFCKGLKTATLNFNPDTLVIFEETDIMKIELKLFDINGNQIAIKDNKAKLTDNSMKFTVTTNGSRNVIFDWYKNGQILTKGVDYTVNGNEYTFQNAESGQFAYTVLAKEPGTALGVDSKTVIVQLGKPEIVPTP